MDSRADASSSEPLSNDAVASRCEQARGTNDDDGEARSGGVRERERLALRGTSSCFFRSGRSVTVAKFAARELSTGRSRATRENFTEVGHAPKKRIKERRMKRMRICYISEFRSGTIVERSPNHHNL